MAQPDDSQSPPGALALPPTFAAIAAGLAVDPAFTSRYASVASTSSTSRLVSGSYLYPQHVVAAVGSIQSAGYLRYVPIIVPRPMTAAKIGIEVTTISTAGGGCRLGLYLAASNNGPDALLLDAGFVLLDSATGLIEIAINQLVPQGLIWACFVAQVANANVRSISPLGLPGVTAYAANPLNTGSYRSPGFAYAGVLPVNATVEAAAGLGPASVPMIVLKVA